MLVFYLRNNFSLPWFIRHGEEGLIAKNEFTTAKPE